jgi:predicted neuraminidase
MKCNAMTMAPAITLLLLAANSSAGSGPQMLSRAVVFNYPETDPYDPANRYGFNHAPSITRLSNGDLLCAWFSGPFEASVHQVILASRSRDDGVTWEKVFVLQDTPRKSDFDPAFIEDGDRTWLFFTAGRWNRYPFVKAEHGGGVGPASYHIYYRQTPDSGGTWSEPVEIPGILFCRSNGIKLTSGELLLPVYSLKKEGDEDKAFALRSTDGGKSWNPGGAVASPGGADEPTIAETTSGHVMMILRTRDGFLWWTLSKDKAQTWSEPVKTNLEAAASSSNLFRLRDGRLVLTHGPCKPPHRNPLTIRVSNDEGRSWGEPLKLAELTNPPRGEEGWTRQVTYPSVAELQDGTLVVVWTEILIGDREQYGNIWSARVRVPAVGVAQN